MPTAWGAGDMTGFHPSQPLAEHQIAFRDAMDRSMWKESVVTQVKRRNEHFD